MAAPLANQPVDHLRVIASFLSPAQLALVGRQSTSLQRQIQPLVEKARVEQQKFQWRLLLKSFGSAEENEATLRQYEVATINLSPEEEEAWRDAFNSLHSPPAPLSAEQRAVLIQRYLPRYHRYLTNEIAGNGNPERDEYLRLAQGNNGVPWSLSKIAMLDADFLSFLRIFAVDGDRFRKDLVEIAIVNSLYPFAQTPVENGQDGHPFRRRPSPNRSDYRGILAALLCIRGSPDTRSLYNWSIHQIFHPALIQGYLDAGVDFFVGRVQHMRYDGQNQIPDTCFFYEALRNVSPFALRLILGTADIGRATQEWINKGASMMERQYKVALAQNRPVQTIVERARVLVQYRYRVDLPALQSLQRTCQIV